MPIVALYFFRNSKGTHLMEFKGQIEYVNEEDETQLFFTYTKIEKELYDTNVINTIMNG